MSQSDTARLDTHNAFEFGAQVKQVAAGGMHSVALKANGEVFTAGVNDEAALGRKTGAFSLDTTWSVVVLTEV